MAHALVLTPNLRHYDWGDPRFIPELLGRAATGKPVAEAWYGAHPVAPAHTAAGTPLDSLVSETLIGPEHFARYGRLPYLLKVLAADRPLSIQVHPSVEQARRGFEREERAGVPRDAAHRCYRDDSEKPELIVALTPFDALCGFRPPEEIATMLERVPELGALLPRRAEIATVLETYFALPPTVVETALAQLLARLEEEALDLDSPEHWALAAHRAQGRAAPDPGLVFVFLLEHVHLEPGQGLFLPAGVPHAYLRGAGIELMASSDNVLRAGLTTKHVDVRELLSVVRFDARVPPIVSPVWDGAHVVGRYPVPAPVLGLQRLELAPGHTLERVANGAETVLCVQGTAIVRVAGEEHSLSPGAACLVPDASPYQVASEQPAVLFVAGVPGREPATSFRGKHPARLTFGTSGLRGLVTDITDLEAYINTAGFLDFLVAIGDAVPGTPVVLAGDQRPSTERILRAVARAVRDRGLTVDYVGRIPTPALTYFGLLRRCPSIMVTGSHIPFDRNGIKFNKSAGEVLKADEADILAAVARARHSEYERDPLASAFDDSGMLRERVELPPASDAGRAAYVRRYLDAFPSDALSGTTVLLYEHSAVGREVLAEVLRGLGATVHTTGRSESFVAIDTEAISDAQLAAIQALADDALERFGRFDAIASTDGDSDRPMLLSVDADGRVQFFGGDRVGLVVADFLQADAIAVPISSSDAIERHFAPRGVKVVRTRIGSPWVIAAMDTLEGERVMGWEANGGFLLASRVQLPDGALAPLPTRDAVLPIVATLSAARAKGQTLGEMFAALPRRHGKSGLLDQVDPAVSRAIVERFGPTNPDVVHVSFLEGRITWRDASGREHAATAELDRELTRIRAALARHFAGFGAIVELDYLDGIRIYFASEDVAHVRPSGNAPQLRIYALADDAARAEEIVAQGLAEPDGILRRLASDAMDRGE